MIRNSKHKTKKRMERVMEGDRNVEKRVHNGKGYVKVRVVNELGRGKKWGEFVKTRKACVAPRKAMKLKGKSKK